jgi:NDP-sugar pyrophosphorylase family protein
MNIDLSPIISQFIDIGTPERYKLANQYLLRMADKH